MTRDQHELFAADEKNETIDYYYYLKESIVWFFFKYITDHIA